MSKQNEIRYKCYLHYKDGLTKKLVLNFFDLEDTWPVWLGEIDSKGADELRYVSIRKFEVKPAEKLAEDEGNV